MNKYLKTILLKEDLPYEEINDYLSLDFKQNIKELFNALLEIVKTGYNEDINLALTNLEKIVLDQDPNNYSIIKNTVRETSYKLNKFNNTKSIKFSLVDLNRKMNISKEEQLSNNIFNFYYYLLFEEKNLKMIELVLKNEKTILNKKDKNNTDLFSHLLKRYCYLDEEDSELTYYYEAIILFLKNFEEDIKNKKEEYEEILNNDLYKNKTHIKEIKERIDNLYVISDLELEKKYHISSVIPKEIENELNSFTFDKKERIYYDSNFVTIDEDDALCLDDAISLVKNDNGSYYYYIAITDIPSLIPYESKTYYNALKNEETIYLCDKNIDLYPKVISNDLCSLLPNQYKNVIMYRYLVTPSYDIEMDSLTITKGIIKVKHRLNYKDVNKQQNLDRETIEMLENMALISYKLKSQNKVKEKYRRIENIINSSATYHHSMFTDFSVSANIVQEAMLLVNKTASKYFLDNGLIYIFRNHKKQDNLIIDNEIERLLTSANTQVIDNEITKVINLIKETYLNAYYSTFNEGHYGLNYSSYSHSTSAARRFADSFNQYLTYEQIFSELSDQRYYSLEETAKEIVGYINDRKKEINKFASEYNYLNSKKLIRKK